MKTFSVITLFPKIIEAYAGESLLARATKQKLLRVIACDLRAFGEGKHKKVDDSPYGGGPGMVLQYAPIAKAVLNLTKAKKKTRIILFSTRGKVFTSHDAKRLSRYENLIFICGRYEGVDERVAQNIADEEISLGNFVLTGGEVPALAVIDAIARFIPGVLGKFESLEEIKGSYPVYTRPEVIETKRGKKKKQLRVPETLIQGDHKKIAAWREEFKGFAQAS